MDKIREVIKKSRREGLSESNIIIKLSEECDISLEESYNKFKEYKDLQEKLKADAEFLTHLDSYAPCDKYGIPMLMPGEEW